MRRLRVRAGAVHEDATLAALKELGFPRERRHQEKFVSLERQPVGECTRQDAESDHCGRGRVSPPGLRSRQQSRRRGRARRRGTYSFDDWAPTTKLLDIWRPRAVAPYSCREGECSACAIRLLEGEVKMLHNDVLDDEDLADGIRLGCQSLPASDVVRATYDS